MSKPSPAPALLRTPTRLESMPSWDCDSVLNHGWVPEGEYGLRICWSCRQRRSFCCAPLCLGAYSAHRGFEGQSQFRLRGVIEHKKTRLKTVGPTASVAS